MKAENRKIKLGILTVMEARVIEEFLIHLSTLFPEIQFDVMFLDNEQLWANLKDKKLDLIFNYLPDENKLPKGIQAKSVYQDSIVFLTHQAVEDNKIENLVNSSWVSYPESTYLPQILRKYYHFKHLKPNSNVIARFSATYQLIQFAQARPYNTFVSKSFYQAHRAKISLQPIQVEKGFVIESSFVWNKENENEAMIDLFITEWDKYLKEQPYADRLDDVETLI